MQKEAKPYTKLATTCISETYFTLSNPKGIYNDNELTIPTIKRNFHRKCGEKWTNKASKEISQSDWPSHSIWNNGQNLESVKQGICLGSIVRADSGVKLDTARHINSSFRCFAPNLEMQLSQRGTEIVPVLYESTTKWLPLQLASSKLSKTHVCGMPSEYPGPTYFPPSSGQAGQTC